MVSKNVLLVLATPALATCKNETKTPPTKYGIILFDGFQALDVFGPIDVLNTLSMKNKMTQYFIAQTLDPVPTWINGRNRTHGQNIVPTHTLDNPPKDIEVLLVPGGPGTREINATQPIVDFIKDHYPSVKYFLSVCTGGALAARSGVLDGKKATTNKRSYDWVIAQGPKVDWVSHARWVVDGNIYSSSGISAGIDMMYAFVTDQYGEEVAAETARDSEYIRNTDPLNDPFAPKLAS